MPPLPSMDKDIRAQYKERSDGTIFRTHPRNVLAVEVRGLVVEGIVRVRLVEDVHEAVDHRVQVQHRLPVLAQNVQADVPVQVDVGVVDGCLAQHLGGASSLVSC